MISSLMILASLSMANVSAETTTALSDDIHVSWSAPDLYLPGRPYEVSFELSAHDAGTSIPSWLLGPAAFAVDGRALGERGDSTLALPAGAQLSFSFDLSPQLGGVQAGGFNLTFAADVFDQPAKTVRRIEAAAEGLNFMEMPADQLDDYHVLISTNRGMIEVEFWPDVAPGHVRNFLDLAYTGFYDGVIFHRVIPGFMVQGGDPTGTGTGSGPRRLQAEFNERKHVRGVLSMARSQDPNSGSCQFFIMHANAPHLDGSYSGFGQVVTGLDVVDLIVNTPRNRQDRPNTEQRIEAAIVVPAG